MRTLALLVLSVSMTACGGESESDSSTGGAGGAGTGGSSSGGNGATGATGATSGSGGGGGAYVNVVGECKTDEDCELQSSCCYCNAVPKGVAAPPCESAPCFVDLCGGEGIQQARCIAGQCTLARNCDPKQALCFSMPPTCAPGQVPSVTGGCWGPCVPATSCESVSSCFDCGAAQACVVLDAWQSSHHCVSPPASCSSGCACLGDKACVGSYNACSDGIQDGSAVHCSCPAC